MIILIVLGLCVLSVKRKWSVIPFIVMACFVSSAQRIVIGGLDFDFLRIMVIFGIARLFLKREYSGFTWRPIDFAVIFWIISSILFFIVRNPTMSALVNRLGFAFDAFGMYFVFRCLVRNWVDIDRIIVGLILISIPLAVLFLLERSTGRNIFSIFGGVHPFTMIRQGRLRCQGAFSHPILAGSFWASVLPLIAAYWWRSRKYRTWTVVGCVSAMIIIFCSASSTPVMGAASAVIAGFMFYARKQMKAIRWGVLITLVLLHLVMQAPVWHLISRISAVGGSTGWHRFNLINQTIIHFKDWWLFGCNGYKVMSWGIWAGDVTNQYILEAIKGGLITMILFIAIIVKAFGRVGKLWRVYARNKYILAMAWALGVSLFTHCMIFIGVTYFGQILLIWYLLLAMIGSMPLKVNLPSQPKSNQQYTVLHK